MYQYVIKNVKIFLLCINKVLIKIYLLDIKEIITYQMISIIKDHI